MAVFAAIAQKQNSYVFNWKFNDYPKLSFWSKIKKLMNFAIWKEQNVWIHYITCAIVYKAKLWPMFLMY